MMVKRIIAEMFAPAPGDGIKTAGGVGWAPVLLLFLLTAAAYIPAMKGEFIWDDDLYAASPVLNEPGCLGKLWTFQYPEKLCYREFPAVYTSMWVERRLWGLDPLGYHLVNILLHAFNAVLAWLILRRLRLPWAWLAGAVFALHPVHVESVAWIAERKNVMSATFYLLALGSYLNFEDGRGRGWYFGSLGLFGLALFSKPVACTLPLIFLLLRWQRGLKIQLRDLAFTAPFFALAVAVGFFTMSVETHPWDPEINLTIAQRILQASRALWFYPAKLVYPANLAFSYERWALDARNIQQWFWPAAVLGAGALVWRYRSRLGRGFIAGAVFYVVNIGLMLGFVSIYTFRYSLVADHYQYLASLGLIAIGVGCAARLLSTAGNGRAGPSAAKPLGVCLCLCALALLWAGTWRQAGIYKSPDRIWLDTVKKNPSSWLAHEGLGASLMRQGLDGQAIEHYQAALAVKPDNEKMHNSLGFLFVRQGRIPEAIGQYREALRLAPGYAEAHHNLGFLLAGQGKIDEAIVHYRAALAANPALADTYNNLGLALFSRGEAAEAIENYKAALLINPVFAKAHNNWGLTLANSGRLDEAIFHFRAALKIDPGYLLAGSNLKAALAEKK